MNGPRIVDTSEAAGHAIPLLDAEWDKVKKLVFAFDVASKSAAQINDTLFNSYTSERNNSRLPEHVHLLLDALMLHIVHKNIIYPLMKHLSTKLAGLVIVSELGLALKKSVNDAFPPKDEFALECYIAAIVTNNDDLALILQVRDSVTEFARRTIKEALTEQGAGSNVISMLDSFLERRKDESNNPNRPTSKD